MWGPLRVESFRALWIAVLVANIGGWMQTVGAQWLLVGRQDAALLVALVQTADALPFLLLAFPAGVFADIFDRRRLLMAVQVLGFVMAGGLAVLTVAGRMHPALLLTLTFLLGTVEVVSLPAWQSMIPDMVSQAQVPDASALSSININVARAVGPAVAGVLVGRLGVGAVFGLTAASFLVFALVVAFWHPPPSKARNFGEEFVAGLRAGARYVRHAPVVRRILVRAALFLLPASALWALLPVIASKQLGLGSGGYGVLLAGLGVGAIGGAFALPWIRKRLSGTNLLLLSSLVYAAILVSFVWLHTVAPSLVLLLVAGVAWVTVLSSINASIQLFLPVWVRARGLAAYETVLFGSQAIGALIWGIVGQAAGLRAAFAAAAGCMALAAAFVPFRPFIDTSRLDRKPAVFWPEPQLTLDPEQAHGSVLVTATYTVSPQNQPTFKEAMETLRESRMRTGAMRWGLYRDADDPSRFVELFIVPTWEEHLMQHGGRLTGADRQIQERANSLAETPPQIDHFLSTRDEG